MSYLLSGVDKLKRKFGPLSRKSPNAASGQSGTTSAYFNPKKRTRTVEDSDDDDEDAAQPPAKRPAVAAKSATVKLKPIVSSASTARPNATAGEELEEQYFSVCYANPTLQATLMESLRSACTGNRRTRSTKRGKATVYLSSEATKLY